jgi:hypothetical protein
VSKQNIGALYPKIIGRREAAAQGMNKFYTGEPCKHGHLAERYVTTAGCLECVRPKIQRIATGYLPNAWALPLRASRPLTGEERNKLAVLIQGWVDHTVKEWDRLATLVPEVPT